EDCEKKEGEEQAEKGEKKAGNEVMDGEKKESEQAGSDKKGKGEDGTEGEGGKEGEGEAGKGKSNEEQAKDGKKEGKETKEGDASEGQAGESEGGEAKGDVQAGSKPGDKENPANPEGEHSAEGDGEVSDTKEMKTVDGEVEKIENSIDEKDFISYDKDLLSSGKETNVKDDNEDLEIDKKKDLSSNEKAKEEELLAATKTEKVIKKVDAGLAKIAIETEKKGKSSGLTEREKKMKSHQDFMKKLTPDERRKVNNFFRKLRDL
ncbi:MAG: hypothetical protein HRT89_02745, partial [Lentisphaeria bacterium]|nr:hypothetical protein [Lentisphaeria bacterium]